MPYPKKRKKPSFPPMKCEDCGVETPRNSVMQKYCPECSQAADLRRKKLHLEKHGKRKYREKVSRTRSQGKTLSVEGRLDIETSKPDMPEMAWYRRVAIPFSWAGSKNHIFAKRRDGHVFMRAESRGMRGVLTEEVFDAVRGVELVQNKLWIDIYVQKPSQHGDAVNFVDMICDAVKDAIPLDDRWYCLRAVDWQITKEDPQIFVGLGQETTEQIQACSSCGRFLTFDHFQRNRGLPHGIGRNCRECLRTSRSAKKSAKAHVEAAIEHRVGIFG